MQTNERIEERELNLKDQVVAINRVTKVVKGGKNLSFSALVVVGDPERHVVGYAKRQGQGSSLGNPQGDRKSEKNLIKVNVPRPHDSHEVLGVFGAGRRVVEADARRPRRHRGRRGPRGCRSRGNPERAHQVDRLEEPSTTSSRRRSKVSSNSASATRSHSSRQGNKRTLRLDDGGQKLRFDSSAARSARRRNSKRSLPASVCVKSTRRSSGRTTGRSAA